MKKKVFSLVLLPLYSLILLSVLVTAVFADKMITVVSQSKPLPKRHMIVIDAGHGGEDGGATSCTGVLESNLNLEIALRLYDLMHLLGYDAILTRTTDTALHTQGDTIAARKASDLKARVEIANSTDNCIWVSIHQNYFTDERYKGAQVFYGASNNSDALGKEIQNNFVKTINQGSNRKAKKIDGVYLFDHMTATGVLIECGFLSNREEEELLRSTFYQKQLCSVVAVSIAGFLS